MADPYFPLPAPTNKWDPRPAIEAVAAPLVGACNIPLNELGARTAELPPRGAKVEVLAAGGLFEEAAKALVGLGRIPVSAAGARNPAEGSLTAAPPFRLWRPNAFLESIMPRLAMDCRLEAGATVVPSPTPPSLVPPEVGKNKGGATWGTRALDLGCGAGREALLMASWGWSVTAADVLPDALEIAQGLESRYSHSGAPRVEWLRFDLEAGRLPPGGPYDLVTSFRYLNRGLLGHANDLLGPGGSLVLETFTEIHRQEFGKPKREEFVLGLGELRERVAGLEILEYDEGWHEGAHTARVWAHKPS